MARVEKSDSSFFFFLSSLKTPSFPSRQFAESFTFLKMHKAFWRSLGARWESNKLSTLIVKRETNIKV